MCLVRCCRPLHIYGLKDTALTTLLWPTPVCMQDLASQAMEVAKGTKGLEEVVDSIREHEMQILNSLVDGSALGQHMEVGGELAAKAGAAAGAAAAWCKTQRRVRLLRRP